MAHDIMPPVVVEVMIRCPSSPFNTVAETMIEFLFDSAASGETSQQIVEHGC